MVHVLGAAAGVVRRPGRRGPVHGAAVRRHLPGVAPPRVPAPRPGPGGAVRDVGGGDRRHGRHRARGGAGAGARGAPPRAGGAKPRQAGAGGEGARGRRAGVQGAERGVRPRRDRGRRAARGGAGGGRRGGPRRGRARQQRRRDVPVRRLLPRGGGPRVGGRAAGQRRGRHADHARPAAGDGGQGQGRRRQRGLRLQRRRPGLPALRRLRGQQSVSDVFFFSFLSINPCSDLGVGRVDKCHQHAACPCRILHDDETDRTSGRSSAILPFAKHIAVAGKAKHPAGAHTVHARCPGLASL